LFCYKMAETTVQLSFNYLSGSHVSCPIWITTAKTGIFQIQCHHILDINHGNLSITCSISWTPSERTQNELRLYSTKMLFAVKSLFL
jgi:hypothetical protein